MIRSLQHLLVPGVVGRERELAELASFVDGIPHGLRVAVLQGGAGVGKTTLARAAVALARERKLALLGCAGSELETELSYAALGDLLEPLLPAGLDALPAPQRRALEVALSLSDPEGAPPDQRAVAIATLGALTAAAARQPLLVAIDDVHWVDGSSLRVLAFAVRRLGDSAVGVVMTRRGDGAPPLGVDRAVDPERLCVLDVGPLPMDAIGRLVRQHLDMPVSRPRLREIHLASEGNPFYALELARTLRDRPPGSEEPLAVPARLRELVAARLGAVGSPARRALLLSAAMARPDVAVLRRCASDVEPGLAEAEQAGLVRLDGGLVRFAHPLVAFTVYDDATARERRAAHRALAALVAGEERAGHLARATVEPDEGVARILEKAARDAQARAAPETAAHFASEAARLTAESEPQRLERLLDAGRAHAAAGDLDSARRKLDELIAVAQPGPLRARALHARSVAAWASDDQLDHVRRLTRAVAEAGSSDDFAAIVSADLATALLQVGHLRAAQRHARDAVAQGGGGPATTVSVMADFLLGEGIRGDLLERASHPASADSPTVMPPDFLRVLLLKWTDRLAEARAGLEELRRLALAEHDDRRLGFVLIQLGELCCWLGDLEAVRDCRRALATIAVHGGQQETFVPFLDAMIYAYVGDADRARAAALSAGEMAQAIADHRFHIRCLAAAGLAELSAGDAAAAAPYLRRAERMSRDAGYAEPGVLRFEHDAVEALVAIDDLDEAERICAGLEACGRRHHRPWPLAAAARSRALLCAEAGELHAAEREMERALAGFRALRQPLEIGRALLHLGIVRRRRRQKRGAREPLEAAAATFASFGALAWAQRAHAEAARISGRRAAPSELTEMERRVAELAADGAMNREIAGDLYISVKTVERHLSNTYAKLGLRSRRELGAAMRDKPRVDPRFQDNGDGLASAASSQGADDATDSHRPPTATP